jgi:hypothetical protein
MDPNGCPQAGFRPLKYVLSTEYCGGFGVKNKSGLRPAPVPCHPPAHTWQCESPAGRGGGGGLGGGGWRQRWRYRKLQLQLLATSTSTAYIIHFHTHLPHRHRRRAPSRERSDEQEQEGPCQLQLPALPAHTATQHSQLPVDCQGPAGQGGGAAESGEPEPEPESGEQIARIAQRWRRHWRRRWRWRWRAERARGARCEVAAARASSAPPLGPCLLLQSAVSSQQSAASTRPWTVELRVLRQPAPRLGRRLLASGVLVASSTSS